MSLLTYENLYLCGERFYSWTVFIRWCYRFGGKQNFFLGRIFVFYIKAIEWTCKQIQKSVSNERENLRGWIKFHFEIVGCCTDLLSVIEPHHNVFRTRIVQNSQSYCVSWWAGILSMIKSWISENRQLRYSNCPFSHSNLLNLQTTATTRKKRIGQGKYHKNNIIQWQCESSEFYCS